MTLTKLIMVYIVTMTTKTILYFHLTVMIIYVLQVLSNLIADFLNITQTDDVKQARLYIMENGVDLDKALCQYYNEL